MNEVIGKIGEVITPIQRLLLMLFGLFVVILAFGTGAAVVLDFRAPWMPRVEPVTLAYFAGAYWLASGGRLK